MFRRQLSLYVSVKCIANVDKKIVRPSKFILARECFNELTAISHARMKNEKSMSEI